MNKYQDRKIVQLCKYGWLLNHIPNQVELQWAEDNHTSANSFSPQVQHYIDREIQYKATIGPFAVPPFEGTIGCSPLSTRPKRDSHERRVIMDSSWPLGHSVNDTIDNDSYLGEQVDLTYPTVDSLAEKVFQIGKNAYLWKRDLNRAFRQIYVDPQDVPLQGFMWEGQWYFDIVLTMGNKISPFIAVSFISNSLHPH